MKLKITWVLAVILTVWLSAGCSKNAELAKGDKRLGSIEGHKNTLIWPSRGEGKIYTFCKRKRSCEACSILSARYEWEKSR